jgi:hypothetical protein
MPALLFKPFLLVVDNFYEDPHAVYEYSKKLTYRQLPGVTGYRSREVYHEKNIKRRLAKLLSLKISEWGSKRNSENGAFFLAFSKGARKETPGIHTDPLINDITVVVYLTPNIPYDCGTSFWRHKETGLWHEPTPGIARKLNIPIEVLRKKIDDECLEKSKWVELDRVAYKFNRMVAFPSGVFHSGSKHFGKDIEEGRIIQTFRLEVDWDTRC